MRQPAASASPGRSAGISLRHGTSAGEACEMSWFWQLRQARLQPAAASEKHGEPGTKWKSGFFSTGSTPMAHTRP